MRNCWTSPPTKDQRNIKLSKINLRDRLHLRIHNNQNESFIFRHQDHQQEELQKQLYPRLNQELKNSQHIKKPSNQVPHTTRTNNRVNQTGLTILILIGFIVIITIAVQLKLTSKSCSERYQDNLCWLQSNSNDGQCRDLQRCIVQEDSNLKQYTFTILAGIGLLTKKYWRQINNYVARHND